MNPKSATFVIKKATTEEDIKAFTDIALKSRLYVSGWMLSGWLINAREKPETVQAVCLVFNESEMPIGVLLALKDRTSAVFVKKFYRRLGLGTKLVQELTSDDDFIPRFSGHDERSVAFFESQDASKIEMEKWW